jgi:hypothetical protein
MKGDTAALCDRVAVNTADCRFLVESAVSSGITVDTTAPRITGHHYTGGGRMVCTLVLHVAGVHNNGKPYTSDFATVVDRDGKVRSLTPVYWSEVRFRG